VNAINNGMDTINSIKISRDIFIRCELPVYNSRIG